jgi:nitrogen-specific signal transduction histidine kinase
VSAAIAFAFVAGVLILAFTMHARMLGTAAISARLEDMRDRVRVQAREVDAYATAYADRRAPRDASGAIDRDAVREIASAVGRQAPGLVIVWVTSDGKAVHTSGRPEDAEATARIVRATGRPAAGPVALPSGPAVLAWHPVAASAAPGTEAVAVIRWLETRAPAEEGPYLVLVDAPASFQASAADGWRGATAPPGYQDASLRYRDGRLVMRAALTGLDGAPAAVVEGALVDPILGPAERPVTIALTLGLGAFMVGLAAGLALLVSRDVGRPLQRFVDYMREQGYLALQGLRPDEELVVDPRLPEDFRELGAVIVDLMTQLRINQADLIEAGEQALAAEQAFRLVVEESPEVKILVRDGVVEIANPAAAHFFGLHLGDLVRASPGGLFAGIGLFDEDGTRLDIAEVASRAADGPVVVRCTAPNHPDRWIEMSVAALDSSMRDYVISARNVTEERRLEALREEILSLVSHDLRSPLTVVRGYVELLERPLDEERRTAAVTNALRAIERMEGLLDDLLHATRAERVFAPTVLRPVDLGWLAEGVAAALQVGAEQRIRVHADADVVVLGDAVRLEQAVTNLVGNAIKYGPAEGEIRIFVSTADGRAQLAVEDDGPGVPADQREAIFERGRRGSGAPSVPGAGLGLYIVKVIAEAHGGTVFVEDAPSGGARFVLDLPLKPETGPAA